MHRALGAALDVVERAQGVGGFLLAHHHAEDTILFPGLRRLGRRRHVDLAFLDARAREHAALHALTERLVAQASRPHPIALELTTLAAELGRALAAHVQQEEAGLSPGAVARDDRPRGARVHRQGDRGGQSTSAALGKPAQR